MDTTCTIKKKCFLVYYIKIEPSESEETLWKKVFVLFKFEEPSGLKGQSDDLCQTLRSTQGKSHANHLLHHT
jgi:hypothetical protein